MILDLRLQRFRSYKDESFEFTKGVNIIVGPNASGKTNLLEGILVSCVGSSYRGPDHELVAFRSAWARLDAHTAKQTRIVKLTLKSDDKLTKQFEIDGHQLTRLPINRTIPVVLFDPNHLQLLHGRPEMRRNFFDDLLDQTVTGYSSLRRHYRRALAQRNRLLKNGQAAKQQLFAWNIRLSELGGRLASERLQLIERFNKGLTKRYSQLADKRHRVVLGYESNCDPAHYSSQLLRRLEQAVEVDMARGFTSYGPHRDDISILLNNKPAEASASRGETRTLVLALKLLELDLIEESREQPAILLLDDVFSELDGKRRRALTDTLRDHQSFITTTDADAVIEHFSGSSYNLIPTGHN